MVLSRWSVVGFSLEESKPAGELNFSPSSSCYALGARARSLLIANTSCAGSINSAPDRSTNWTGFHSRTRFVEGGHVLAGG